MTPDPTLIEQVVEAFKALRTDHLPSLEELAEVAVSTLQGSAALPSEAIDPHEIALSSLYWASNPSLVDATNRLREAGYNNAAGHLSNHMAGRFLDAYMAAKATLEALSRLSPTPETGLVEALQGYLSDCNNEECERCIAARKALSNVLPDEV